MTPRKKPTKKPRSKPRRGKASPPGNGLRVALAVVFLGAFLLGSLVFLSQMREHYQPPPSAPNQTLLLEDVRVELESALLRSGASLKNLKATRRGELTELSLAATFPSRQVLDELRLRLQRLSPSLSLKVDRPTRELSILVAGTRRYSLQFAPAKVLPAPAKAQVAIIMDDLGRDMQTARELLQLSLPVTLSILPNTRHAAEVATLAHRRGREVMIHIPMEPLGYPATSPGDNALLVKLSKGEIKQRFYSYLDKIPYAVGGNNHMGSRFTASARLMRPVLEIMRGEGLFFVDSRTSSNSVAAAEAKGLGLAVASRDIFLDNEADVERIVLQIRKLANLAARKGSAIGICHPHPQTIEALRREQGYLQEQGIKVVTASTLVHH